MQDLDDAAKAWEPGNRWNVLSVSSLMGPSTSALALLHAEVKLKLIPLVQNPLIKSFIALTTFSQHFFFLN